MPGAGSALGSSKRGGPARPHWKGNIVGKPNRGKEKIMADFHESEPPSCGIFSSIYSFLFLVGIEAQFKRQIYFCHLVT